MREGWQIKRLGDVCEFRGGGTPSKAIDRYWKGDIPWVSPKDMKSQVVDDSIDHITPEAVAASATAIIDAGAILMVVRSGILARTVPIAFAGRPLALNQDLKALCPGPCIDSWFLYYLLEAKMPVLLSLVSRGATVHRLTTDQIRALKFMLPPLAEQRRIVAILDEAFEGIATTRANAETNLKNAGDVFEGYLATVFSTRNCGWMDRPLDALCSRITVGHVGSMASLYKPSGIPFLRSQNIRPFSVSMENMVFIDETFHAALGKSSLKAGDVAIVRTGYPGTAAVIPESLGVANCSDLVIIKPGPLVSAHFLAAFFNSAFGKRMVSGKVVGAAQKHFNVGAAKDVVLHLPPLAEQEAIIAAAGNLRAETSRLEGIYKRKLGSLDALKKAVLHQAFTGSL